MSNDALLMAVLTVLVLVSLLLAFITSRARYITLSFGGVGLMFLMLTLGDTLPQHQIAIVTMVEPYRVDNGSPVIGTWRTGSQAQGGYTVYVFDQQVGDSWSPNSVSSENYQLVFQDKTEVALVNFQTVYDTSWFQYITVHDEQKSQLLLPNGTQFEPVPSEVS